MNRRHLTRGVIAAALAFVAIACAPDPPDGAGSAQEAREASVAAVSAAGVLQPGDTVEFFASEFAFAPHEITAEPGTYTGMLVNQGEVDHDIKFDNGEKVVAGSGESVEFEFTVPEEGVAFSCTISGHADAGMVGVANTPTSLAADPVDEDADHAAPTDEFPVVELDPERPSVHRSRSPSSGPWGRRRSDPHRRWCARWR